MKRIRRRTRNRIIGVSSTLVVLVLGVMLVWGINRAGNVDPANYDVQTDLLGKAQNYGIVTEWLNQGYHFDSNFAAKYFTGTHACDGNFTVGKFTGGNPLDVIATRIGPPTNEDLQGYSQKVGANGSGTSAIIRTAESKTLANLQKKFHIENLYENPQDPSSHAVEVDDNGKTKYLVFDQKMDVRFEDADKLDAEVDGMLNSVFAKSKEIAGRRSVQGNPNDKGIDYTVTGGPWDATVDISMSDDNVVYVDAPQLMTNIVDHINIQEGTDGGRFKKGNDSVIRLKNITVKKRADQYIVFNFVKYTNEVTAAPTATPNLNAANANAASGGADGVDAPKAQKENN